MAENKTLKTRIQQKYDTYANWTKNNPTPLAGELCIVEIPAQTNAEGVAKEPVILMKVGDGTTGFNSLPFIGAVAADVYDWAKAKTKPEYQASEITGLETYISSKVEDTDTQYQLVQDDSDGHKIKLQSKAKGTEVWADVVTITTVDTVYDDKTIKSDITSLQGLVGDTAVATQITNALADYVKSADIADHEERIATNESAIETLNGTGDGSVKKTAEDAAATAINDWAQKVTENDTIDTFKEVVEYVAELGDTETLLADVAQAKADSTQNKTDVASLKELVGSTAVSEQISTAVSGLDGQLAAIAKSGDVNDLTQAGGYVIFDCGSSSENI